MNQQGKVQLKTDQPQTGEAPRVRLTPSLSRRCTELLLRVEQPSILDPLTPRDCLDLWSSLGYLGHGVWSQDPSPSRELDVAYKSLQGRLSKLLATHLNQLLKRLDKGTVEALSRIDSAIREAENGLRKGRIGTWLTSYEFNAVLLDPRDRIGYAQLCMNELGVNLAPGVLKGLEAADERLREVLPAAIQELRGAGDDPTPDPRSFPESFWWRHL